MKEAISEGFFGPLASQGDLRQSGSLGLALAHMKLLQLIVSRNIPAANIFEDDEIVYSTYKNDRRKVLNLLPDNAEFVNLNPHDPRGEPVEGSDGKLFRMTPGIPRWSNIWLSNYYVSREGSKKLLGMMRHYDLGPSGDEQIDWHVVAVISSGCSVCHINGYAYTTNALSMHCENYSIKEEFNKDGMPKGKPDKSGASLAARDPIDPMCMQDAIEGKWR